MTFMTERDALRLCRAAGAFLNGHFVGTQGDEDGLGWHMSEYFDGRLLITYPDATEMLAQGIAHSMASYHVDVVVGTPIGSLTLGHEVAKALRVRYVMAEKTASGLVIARDAFIGLMPGMRVGLIEDTVTSGKTLFVGKAAIEAHDGAGTRQKSYILNW